MRLQLTWWNVCETKGMVSEPHPTMLSQYGSQKGGVYGVRFRPNMKHLVSGGGDNVVYLWSMHCRPNLRHPIVRPYRYVGHQVCFFWRFSSYVNNSCLQIFSVLSSDFVPTSKNCPQFVPARTPANPADASRVIPGSLIETKLRSFSGNFSGNFSTIPFFCYSGFCVLKCLSRSRWPPEHLWFCRSGLITFSINRRKWWNMRQFGDGRCPPVEPRKKSFSSALLSLFLNQISIQSLQSLWSHS